MTRVCVTFLIFNISQKISEVNLRGTPENFWSFVSPHKVCFIAFLSKNFRKFSKFGVLCPVIFSKKSPIFPRNFVAKLVQYDYIDQNLAKFSHKSPKNVHFVLKTLNFSKFSAPSAPKTWSVISKKPIFFVSPPLGPGSLLIYLWKIFYIRIFGGCKAFYTIHDIKQQFYSL